MSEEYALFEIPNDYIFNALLDKLRASNEAAFTIPEKFGEATDQKEVVEICGLKFEGHFEETIGSNIVINDLISGPIGTVAVLDRVFEMNLIVGKNKDSGAA